VQGLGSVLNVNKQNRAGDLRLVNVSFWMPHGKSADAIL
jgi:hypothetical protein